MHEKQRAIRGTLAAVKTALRRTARLAAGFGRGDLRPDRAPLPVAYLRRRGSETSEADKRSIWAWLIRSFLNAARGASASTRSSTRRVPPDGSSNASQFPNKSAEFAEEELHGLAKITIRRSAIAPSCNEATLTHHLRVYGFGGLCAVLFWLIGALPLEMGYGWRIGMSVAGAATIALGIQIAHDRWKRLQQIPHSGELPDGFLEGDCGPRALAEAGVMAYETAVVLMKNPQGFHQLVKQSGWKAYERNPRLRPITFRDFAKTHPRGTYIVAGTHDDGRGHAAAIVDGFIRDSWDSGGCALTHYYVARQP